MIESHFESRYAIGPEEVKGMDTTQLRKNFLIDKIFDTDKIIFILTNYDRYIAGGIMPISEIIQLPNPEELKAAYFLERRELGIFNVGGKGSVMADGISYELGFKEALYIGRGTKHIQFSSPNKDEPAKFYFNSAPAHASHPTKKVSIRDAEIVELGNTATANQRIINKLLVNSIVPTCQLQMGMTELKNGSVWNTMPPHTHNRRMEVYFYFEVPEGQSICHFMGQPQETRHIWMQNEQAVISPNWSIHAGAGTCNYSFIWGMAGENLDYGDMDVCAISELK